MSSYYFNASQQSSTTYPHSFLQSTHSSHNHHGGRPRRTPRYSSSQSKQFKSMRNPKETAELAQAANFRKDFEAARSFDIEDDELFCPWHLLTEDDVSTASITLNSSHLYLVQLQSINSSLSDRSSSSSGSPENSPFQHELQPLPTLALPSAAHPYGTSSTFQPSSTGHMKIHQPLAQRSRNAIPIVDPNSRNVSPPTSLSPAHQMDNSYVARRW